MRNILIIAGREFRQIASMRSFWLTLLIIPLCGLIGGLTPRLIHIDEPDRVMIIDRSGDAEAEAIGRRIELDQDRTVLTQLSRYVQRHHLERASPGALWSQHDRWYSDSDVATFNGQGGLKSAQSAIDRVKQKDTPDFEASNPDYELVPVPAALSNVSDNQLDNELKPVLKPKGKGAKAVDYVILVPAGFGSSPLVKLWANKNPSPQFVSLIQDVLTRDLRSRYLVAQGLAPAAAQNAGTIAPALTISSRLRAAASVRRCWCDHSCR